MSDKRRYDHPNSINANATKEQKAMIRAGRLRAKEEARSMEAWYNQGCLSVGTEDRGSWSVEEIAEGDDK